jgi:hypothetical protein
MKSTLVRRVTSVVNNSHVRIKDQAAHLAQPQRQIEILKVQEKTLIKAADHSQIRGSNQHEATTRYCHIDLSLYLILTQITHFISG